MISKNIRACLLILSLAMIDISCKKENDPIPNNNEIHAVVVRSSGTAIKIKATADKAVFGCGFFGGTYLEGTYENNAVFITVFQGNACVTSPGTYNFDCHFRPAVTSPISPIYVNHFGSNRGSITFTLVSHHQMEGYFNAVCKTNPDAADSVIVTGTFKGDYIKR